jgi:hypothetical protein
MLNDIERWENEGGRPASRATAIAAAAATRRPVRERPREAASRVVGGHLLNGPRHYGERFVTTPSCADAGDRQTEKRP